MYQYASYRDRSGLPAWFSCATRRWVSRRTVAKRTGLPLSHLISFENGRDGYGYRETRDVRQQREIAAGVVLF